jgi:hypothetical protein
MQYSYLSGALPFLRKLRHGAVAKILASVFIFTPATNAPAAQVAWTDWISQSQFTDVSGSLSIISQEVILETREVLTMSKKHQKLLALADSGGLNKKKEKKLGKLEERYSEDLKLLSLSSEEKEGLGKKDKKRLKKISKRVDSIESPTTIDVMSTIDVMFSGSYGFAQTDGGTNYWSPSAPYISTEVENAPPASDIIALSTGGDATITFSQTVVNPLIALVSWNGNTVDFGVPIEILSYGAGYWGNGTPVLNEEGTGFFGSGEVHGVIRLPGSYDSISFTHTSENWHGFTVGVTGVSSPSEIPVPAAVWLFGSGLLGLVGVAKRKKSA